MHKKVMLVLPDGSRRWGYATTEIPEKSDTPYITTRNRRTDDYASIVCNDTEVISLLRKYSFPVSDSVSISKKTSAGIAFPSELYDKIKSDAEQKKQSISDVVVQILKDHYNEQAD